MPAGALPAALRLGQAAAASGAPGKQARHECRGTERRAAEHAEVGVQVVVPDVPDGSQAARCLLCGREATCAMADLKEEDKQQIGTVLQQVLELSDLNEATLRDLAAERQARTEERAAGAAREDAMVGEVGRLREKLAHALDLLRAYQKRVRDMQQALVTSDQALGSLQHEHKMLLVRTSGSRAIPPTPPPAKVPVADPGAETDAGELSAAVESIAAALACAEESQPHTPPREAQSRAGEAGNVASHENTPAPQLPPAPHILDESSSALQGRVAATVAAGAATIASAGQRVGHTAGLAAGIADPVAGPLGLGLEEPSGAMRAVGLPPVWRPASKPADHTPGPSVVVPPTSGCAEMDSAQAAAVLEGGEGDAAGAAPVRQDDAHVRAGARTAAAVVDSSRASLCSSVAHDEQREACGECPSVLPEDSLTEECAPCKRSLAFEEGGSSAAGAESPSTDDAPHAHAPAQQSPHAGDQHASSDAHAGQHASSDAHAECRQADAPAARAAHAAAPQAPPAIIAVAPVPSAALAEDLKRKKEQEIDKEKEESAKLLTLKSERAAAVPAPVLKSERAAAVPAPVPQPEQDTAAQGQAPAPSPSDREQQGPRRHTGALVAPAASAQPEHDPGEDVYRDRGVSLLSDKTSSALVAPVASAQAEHDPRADVGPSSALVARVARAHTQPICMYVCM